jgi:hypothetical protein|tara:strand:+ start:490 stop:693 length:204 start_codon:yes stop_codon:yes gene_type:complete
MAGPQYIDFFIDPDTGEIEVKIEGFPDAVCDAMAAEVIKNLGVQDAKVVKTGSHEGGDGQKRTQSIS